MAGAGKGKGLSGEVEGDSIDCPDDRERGYRWAIRGYRLTAIGTILGVHTGLHLDRAITVR